MGSRSEGWHEADAGPLLAALDRDDQNSSWYWALDPVQREVMAIQRASGVSWEMLRRAAESLEWA